MQYADVIIDISHEKVDRTFQYFIPEPLRKSIKEGDCVKVPFGKGDTLRTGFVVGLSDVNEFPVERMKEIKAIDEDATSIDAPYVKLAAWMRNNYGSTMIAALRTVLPAKKIYKPRQKKKLIRKMDRDEILSLYAECIRKHQSAKARVLKELADETILPYDLVTDKLNVSGSTINALENAGALRIEVEDYYRNPVNIEVKSENAKLLSDEQKYICDEINKDTDEGNQGRYLIHGITGSGKTEVYLNLIEHVVSKGKQCIMLIPEIALTYQTLMRFYKRFGDRVSLINSTLSPGERYDQCMRAKNGDIDVIIGPRSALFVPFKDLGMVIIDEEHEQSYISEQTPKYHARETAEELCRIRNASLVLGSATPSLESYYLAEKGYYRLFKLTKRLTGASLPETMIVDMREELKNGNKSMFSTPLREAIEDRLNKHEQIILFLNRRGYSGFISCRSCGSVIKCPHCDVSLVRHRGGKLICHYCGYETADVKKCPECSSPYISGFKAGTEQVEESILKEFPTARVLRMDADTTKTKNSYEEILSDFADKKADILLGTQMIVKGHDFPLVTLVGVIAADLSLNESDFRTSERTFNLLCQAVGRAGRGTKEGLSIIQTYRPEHYSIIRAASQDYEGFYKEEIIYRSICDYPPVGMMLEILVTSPDEKRALGLATALKKRAGDKVNVIGPSKAFVSKINDVFRYTLYLKSSNKEEIIKARSIMEEYLETAPIQKETVTFDVK